MSLEPKARGVLQAPEANQDSQDRQDLLGPVVHREAGGNLALEENLGQEVNLEPEESQVGVNMQLQKVELGLLTFCRHIIFAKQSGEHSSTK